MKKILFLDFDGVLNSHRSSIANCSYPTSNSIFDNFDPIAIGLIRVLCKKTGAEICLSSTWRKSNDWRSLGFRLDLPIKSRTPILESNEKHFDIVPRGYEINAWLRENPVDKYAIVDDDSDMLPVQLPYFVRTNPENGLSMQNYDQLLNLLGELKTERKPS